MATATKTREYVYHRPLLKPYQIEALFTDDRYGVIEASTKAGKTVGCMVWLSEQAMRGKAGQNYWWIAPIFAQTKIAFRRLKRALPHDVYRANESELTLTMPNGAVMWFKGAENPDSLYGEDVFAAVVDEASRVREESWHALRSTLTATRGPVRIIGNVKGRKNWFYQMARRAESGDANMHYARITWRDAVAAGIFPSEEIDDARAQLPENVFRELYDAEASDDEGNPFGIAAIRACVAPLSPEAPVIWAWDLGRAVDWTVGVAIDGAGCMCRFERFQKPWPETINIITEITAGVPTIVDGTGLGDVVVAELQSRHSGVFENFKFTSQSKQQIMEGLAISIQRHEIGIPDGVCVAELESFEYVYTRTGVRYSAPEGQHDDCVCALALARHGLVFGVGEVEERIIDDDMVTISPY